MLVRRVLRALVPAAVVAGLLAAAPTASFAETLPCPTVDGRGYCYDVTVTVVDLPSLKDPGDATFNVTVTASGHCASGGCLWGPIGCGGLGCVVLDAVFGAKTVGGRTGAEDGDATLGEVPITTVDVPRVCLDDDPSAICVGGFPLTVSAPTVSGTIATVWVLGVAIPVTV